MSVCWLVGLLVDMSYFPKKSGKLYFQAPTAALFSFLSLLSFFGGGENGEVAKADQPPNQLIHPTLSHLQQDSIPTDFLGKRLGSIEPLTVLSL